MRKREFIQPFRKISGLNIDRIGKDSKGVAFATLLQMLYFGSEPTWGGVSGGDKSVRPKF
jgi:hypothetical protein